MPRKRKTHSLSPLRRPSASSSSTTDQPSSTALPLPPAMSNNNQEGLLSSMYDMFPDLDPSLIEMVLTEYKEVEVVMDHLLELSTSAKVEPDAESADILGFDGVAAVLHSNNQHLLGSRTLENTAHEHSDIYVSQAEDCTALSNNLDLLLDEAINKYSLCSSSSIDLGNYPGQCYIPDNNNFPPQSQSTSAVIYPKLIDGEDAVPKDLESDDQQTDICQAVPYDNKQISADLESNDQQTAIYQTVESDNKQNSASIETNCASQLSNESDTECKISSCCFPEAASDEIGISETASEEKSNLNETDAGVKPPSHATSMESWQNNHVHKTPIWNPLAPSFHPTSDLQPRFFTPTAVRQAPWNFTGGVRNISRGLYLTAPVPSFTWSGNFSPNTWQTYSMKSAALLEAVPHPAVQNVKKNTVFVGKVLILLRGAPGSGKTTSARMLLQQNQLGIKLSTDDYFYKNGQYHYDVNLLGEAHEWNHKRAKEAFEKNISPIIIDNTNMQAWEMKPYVSMALKHKYKVTFREPDTWWKYKPKELERRNSHGVTKEKIKRMLENFERVTVNSILNLSRTKGPEQTDLDQIKQNAEKGGENYSLATLKDEEVICTFEEKVEDKSDSNMADEGEALHDRLEADTSKNYPDILLNYTDSLRKIQKSSHSEDERYDRVEDIYNSQHPKTTSDDAFLNPTFPENEITIKENVTEDALVLLPGETPELLNFVGDWPVEHTMGQRAPRSRSKIRENSKSKCSLHDGEEANCDSKQLDSHTITHDLLKQCKEIDNCTALPALRSCNEENMHLEDQVCSPLEREEEVYLPHTAQSSESNHAENDPQAVTEVTKDLQSLDLSNIKEDEVMACETPEKKRPSKRSIRQCKLALTFTNSCSDSSQTEDILTYQQNTPVNEVHCGPSKYSQTEPHELALAWRVEKKNVDISNSTKVLTGNSERFQPKQMDESSDSQESIPYRVMHHKSTFVEESEIVSLDDDHNLNILARLFRSVSFDVLTDLYERCSKDIVWVSNLLLDSGEKIYKDEDCQTEEYLSVLGDATLDVGPPPDQVTVCPDDLNMPSFGSAMPQNDDRFSTSLDEKREHGDSHTVTYNPNVTFSEALDSEYQNVYSVPDISNTQTIERHEMVTKPTDIEQPKDTGLQPVICLSDLEMEPSQKTDVEINTITNNVLETQNIDKDACELPLSDINKHDKISGFAVEEVDETKRKNSDSLKDSLNFDHLELCLPPELAFQLSELFGPVGIAPGSLTIEDCTVHIDLNLAKAIHKRWKESITERQKQESLSYQLLFEDLSPSELDTLINEEPKMEKPDTEYSETSYDAFPFMDQWNVQTKKVSLREIMSEEIALQEQECQKKSTLRAKNCAAKLKEKQLFELFPNIEQRLLMDIFKENNYSLEKTAEFLSAVLEAGPVQNVVAPNLKQTEASTSENPKSKKLNVDKDTIPENFYQDYEFPEYDDFRAEAFLYRRKQQECYRKASEAHSRGMKQVATYYAQQGYLYAQKMKQENHRAAVQIFERANEFLLPENILDLHGLHVSEAMKHFRQVLQNKMDEYKKNGGKSYLSVITGRGNHSQGGVPRIKLAVIDYLTNHSFRFQEVRPGVLHITLK
ncbi:NEDD4-binding protein 2 [Xenopus laevis]|uniref:NEDD4-binding protein 2 n=2 Tax=Xenopus laevis TaxID=8355 RepID=A0A1L8HTP7_XENLA|nr:NEDD4-binding protein 2 [Xenopus laevis]XP_041444420.1 NEDD4-binding protein 2 [Xenopus laevis]XP_041444423.1 NEDD4-binding protein 2 [Xenopus laevis]OCT99444.1 hypothetical protein XELAEV_18005224mg [Xenopus laevis]